MNNSNQSAICTIVSKNYLAYALTLIYSIEKVQDNELQDIYLLIVDRRDNAVIQHMRSISKKIQFIWLEDLPIKNLEQLSFKYNILELNTNVKPTLLKYLMRNYDKIIYLDPDVYVYSSLSGIYDQLDQYDILLTPHILTSNMQQKNYNLPSLIQLEQNLLRVGVYNLGFIALKRTDDVLKFLDSWEFYCLNYAFNEVENSSFVDQKWVGLISAYCENLGILRSAGINVAHWNIEQRELTRSEHNQILINKDKLVFFHYSGMTEDIKASNRLSKYSPHYIVADGSILQELLHDYWSILTEYKFKLQHKYSDEYTFARFSNGEIIHDLTRRIYSQYNVGDTTNPFEINNKFYQLCRKNNLLTHNFTMQPPVVVSRLKTSKRAKFLLWFMRVILKILGVNKFYLLMRFVNYYTIPTNFAQIYSSSLNLGRDTWMQRIYKHRVKELN